MIFRAPALGENETAMLEEIDRIRREVRYVTARPRRWAGMLRTMMFAGAVRGSNSIEGYNASIEDAIAAVQGIEPFNAEGETWNAITSFRCAMTYVLQLANDPSFRYEQGFIRSLHYMMLQYDLSKNPGNWRPGAIFVRDEAKKEIVYTAPQREEIEPLIAELIQSLNAENTTPALIRAAMAHLNLVMIHPFSDGNGRMARALHTLVLVREGILEPEFCSIEEYLGIEQQAYYDVLAHVGKGHWHPERDAMPWIKFIFKAHFVQAHRILWWNEQMSKVWIAAEELAKERGLPTRAIQCVADALLNLRVRNAVYREFARVSENLASRDLKLLVEKKILIPAGEKRGRYYEPSPQIKDLRKKVFAKFVPPETPILKKRQPEQRNLPGMA